MRITNLNPDNEIGASSWLVEMDGRRLLLDAGFHPKRFGRDGLPLYGQVASEDVDAIAISHCHHDHVGSLPVALRHFPQAHVFMTDLSYFIVERVLHNSVNVMLRQRDERGIRDLPLYTHREVDEIAPIFQALHHGEAVPWTGTRRRGAAVPTLEFRDAGHALGSAGVLARGRGGTLFYTGDVSFRDQTLLKGARFDGIRSDVLLMETTRGGRAPDPEFTRQREVERLVSVVEEILEDRGCVLIPTFALGRSQEILALLALLMDEGRLRRQPVFIGGLTKVFTEIYDLQAHRTNRHLPDLELRDALHLVVLERHQAYEMRLRGGKIFVLTAGMMSENTLAHEMAVRMVEDPRHGILFVGYADPDSPAGRLRAAAPGETFFFSEPAGELRRRCRVEEFDLSAHANRDELLEFVGRVQPRTVILGHGDDEARAWFHDAIRDEYPKTRVVVPQPGETVEAPSR